MHRRLSFSIFFLGVGALYAGCGGDESLAGPAGGAGSSAATGGSGGGAALSGLPCAVERVLRERCQTCHGSETAFGAPMPLVTRQDLLGPAFSDRGQSAAALAVARMVDGGRPMPPPPNARATSGELAAVRAWVDAGMPEAAPGDTCSGGSGGAGGVVMPGNCQPDVVLAAATPYEMPQNLDDQYVCFGFELPAGPKRHIIAAAPAIDNTKIVHHLITFQVPAGEGYGPTPTPCPSTFPPNWKMIYGWGPGGLPLDLPTEAGFPTEDGAPTRFVVQAHYSNLTREAGQLDQTAINLCSTTELRPNDADVVAFGGAFFSISAGKRVKLDCRIDASAIAGGANAKVFRAWPHMHKIGESFLGQARHSGGATTALGAVLDYDFEHQLSYDVDATLAPGDVIESSCTWDNTLGTSDVLFGEQTANEMCFNFLSYYPRAPLNNALAPAYTANCSTTEL